MAVIQRDNPYPNYNFEVSIVGIADDGLGFSEVELPSGEIEVIEYREGRDAATVRKLPGLVTYPNVTLKRGINGYLELYNWWKSARDGDIQRTYVSIRLLDERRQEVMRWSLSRAWPVKLEAGPLNAQGNEVAIETLELAFSGPASSLTGQARLRFQRITSWCCSSSSLIDTSQRRTFPSRADFHQL